LVALFSAAQLLPAGTTFAAESNGFALVMCTPEGQQTFSWEELTGEPSPFDAPSHDDGSSAPCHACVTGACHGTAFRVVETFLPNVTLLTPAASQTVERPLFVRTDTGPPLPSRSPPFYS